VPFHLPETALPKLLQGIYFFMRRSELYEIVNRTDAEGMLDETYRVKLNPRICGFDSDRKLPLHPLRFRLGAVLMSNQPCRAVFT
jgi:hypothetical protein